MHDEELIKIHCIESTNFKYFSRAMKEFIEVLLKVYRDMRNFKDFITKTTYFS